MLTSFSLTSSQVRTALCLPDTHSHTQWEGLQVSNPTGYVRGFISHQLSHGTMCMSLWFWYVRPFPLLAIFDLRIWKILAKVAYGLSFRMFQKIECFTHPWRRAKILLCHISVEFKEIIFLCAYEWLSSVTCHTVKKYPYSGTPECSLLLVSFISAPFS